ncbi:MAG: hypothetical protein RLZZ516_2516, partial [Cyanobacteriota bacterium]
VANHGGESVDLAGVEELAAGISLSDDLGEGVEHEEL